VTPLGNARLVRSAVQAHIDLGPPETVGMHFGTFRLAAEAIDAPIRDLDDARRANGISWSRFRVLEFGETTHIGRAT
jgi:L-ascorbate metabolism protein UlaG (beta-lactamase superfamily)